mmetsp:Transcript_175180/g.426115  ORF Transcript_175180/g.426115 Transcript_175180/m.426115 type:complete len:201 (-) Transcript_175180:40-642(-)
MMETARRLPTTGTSGRAPIPRARSGRQGPRTRLAPPAPPAPPGRSVVACSAWARHWRAQTLRCCRLRCQGTSRTPSTRRVTRHSGDAWPVGRSSSSRWHRCRSNRAACGLRRSLTTASQHRWNCRRSTSGRLGPMRTATTRRRTATMAAWPTPATAAAATARQKPRPAATRMRPSRAASRASSSPRCRCAGAAARVIFHP